MARITNAEVLLGNNGQVIPSQCYGNNAAIECPDCHSYPVLLTARPGWPGSALENPSTCRGCGRRIYMLDDVGPGLQLRVIHVALE